MRRFTHVISTLILSIAIVACGGATGDNGGTDPTDPAPEETYDASGVITDQDVNLLEGVTLTLDGAEIDEFTVTTAADGTWNATGLTGEVTVTPTDPAFDFTPNHETITEAETDVDFEGTLKRCNGSTDGTPGNPCEITRVEQLQLISELGNLTDHYILGSDINAASTVNWNNGEGFAPIGTASDPFNGVLNGDGYTITGLFVERLQQSYVGMFRNIGSNATIKNAHFVDITVRGTPYDGTSYTHVGAIAAVNNGRITGVTVDGGVKGREIVGGFVGENNGTIDNSENYAYVVGRKAVGGIAGVNTTGGDLNNVDNSGKLIEAVNFGGEQIGGIVGRNHGTVQGGSNAGHVEGNEQVGGIIGENHGTASHLDNYGKLGALNGPAGGVVGLNEATGIVQYALNRGTIYGDRSTGGIVGENNGEVDRASNQEAVLGDRGTTGGIVGYNLGEVTRSYNLASVTDNSNIVGGISGRNAGELSDVYNLGNVSGAKDVGGITGVQPNSNSSSIHNSFSVARVVATDDSSTAGNIAGTYGASSIIEDSYFHSPDWQGTDNPGGGTAKSEAALKQQSTFTNWDFTAVWTINEDVTFPDIQGIERP